MKRIILASLAVVLLLSACKKNKDSNAKIEVTLNGQRTTLTVESVQLTRQREYNNKSLTISAFTEDQKYLISFGVIQQTAEGNGVAAKAYMVDFGDEVPEGYSSVAKKNGSSYSGSSYEGVGSIAITSCNEGARTVSGTFAIKLTEMTSSDSHTTLTLTEGRFENLKYVVVN